MAKKKKTKNEGEQMALMDDGPKDAAAIIEKTKEYKKAQSVRIKALKEETDLKEEILALVKASELQPLKDGVIKFSSGGYTFRVTPRDELITITEKKKTKKKDMKKQIKDEELKFDGQKT